MNNKLDLRKNNLMKKINFDLSGSFEANMKRFDSKGYPANKS